jgi:hypothetical protein
MLMEQPAWLLYDGDRILDKKFTYAGGYQSFKNAMQTAKSSGKETENLKLVKGTLVNKGGTHWDLLQDTAKQILP